ncbi:MAG: ATP-binding protein [Bacteroidota bacterium]
MPDLYHDAFVALAAPAAIIDATGRVVDANAAFAGLLGRALAGLRGQPVAAVLVGLPADLSRPLGNVQVSVHGNDRNTVRLACAAAPLASGGAVLTLRPTPELSGWPHQLIIEAIREAITIRGADGRIICSNSAARTLLGPNGSPEFIHWDGTPLAEHEHPALVALASDHAVGAIIGARQSDGGVRWLQVHSAPIRHPEAGRAVVSCFAEINQLVEARRRAADSERRFRAIFDQTFEFIGLLDTEGRLLEANATALAFIDKTLAEIAGQHFADTPWWSHSPADQSLLRDGIARAAAGQFVRFETSHPGVDGRVATIDFSLKPVTDESGQVIYIIPEGRNITHLKKAQQELMDAKMQAEAANLAKSAFLAAISHELRTPLNAVIGFSETILEQVFGPLGNARYSEYVEMIHTAGSHLRDVIEDILDVARIETGEVSLREAEMDLRQCLSSVVEMIRPKAHESRIALIADLPADLPRLRADQLRLRQIVLNLLSNAVKFTPPGGRVRLWVDIEADGLALHVADTGIGIRPEDMEHIWTPFFQAEATLSRRFGGTGLGLPIVRHYAEAHGGSISVDSTPGQGATFTLRLPAERMIRPANDVVAQPQRSGKTKLPQRSGKTKLIEGDGS